MADRQYPASVAVDRRVVVALQLDYHAARTRTAPPQPPRLIPSTGWLCLPRPIDPLGAIFHDCTLTAREVPSAAAAKRAWHTSITLAPRAHQPRPRVVSPAARAWERSPPYLLDKPHRPKARGSTCEDNRCEALCRSIVVYHLKRLIKKDILWCTWEPR